MWNEPKGKRMEKIPALYETDGVPVFEKVVHLHFFMGGSDWYITEFDQKDIFFGYAILNEDLINAEWGYISFSELKTIKIGFMEIDCELAKYWKPKMMKDIQKLKYLCEGN